MLTQRCDMLTRRLVGSARSLMAAGCLFGTWILLFYIYQIGRRRYFWPSHTHIASSTRRAHRHFTISLSLLHESVEFYLDRVETRPGRNVARPCPMHVPRVVSKTHIIPCSPIKYAHKYCALFSIWREAARRVCVSDPKHTSHACCSCVAHTVAGTGPRMHLQTHSFGM